MLATATPQLSSDEELFQYLAMQTTEMDTPVSKFDELGDIINKSVPYNSQSASLADEMMDAENGFTNLWNTGCGGICRHRAALLTDAARYQGLDATDLSFKTGKFKPTGDEIRHKVSILTSDSTIYVKDPGLRVDFLDLYLEEKYPNASSFEAYDFTKKKKATERVNVSCETILLQNYQKTTICNLVCARCAHHWVEGIPLTMRLMQVECPYCHHAGSVVRS